MIRADKRFGQHFLVNEGVVERIGALVESQSRLDDGSRRTVIEIGPGPGALTQELLKRSLKVVAIELDERMVFELRLRFEAEILSGALTILPADAMRVPLEQIKSCLAGPRAVVCGNLPYNVGSQIVFRFLEEFGPADRFCYMLQKEVVLKFISASLPDPQRRDYGPPGIKLAWCARVGGHFWVKPGSFQPPPKVDSGVFWFDRLSEGERVADALERGGSYDAAGEVLANVFRQRRKMLKAAYRSLADTDLGTKRAEELSPMDLFRLVELVNRRS